MFSVSIAGIPVGIESKHKYIERISRDYLTDREPLFTVSASEADMAYERERNDPCPGDGYIESAVIHRKIAEQLWRYDAFLFHGAVLSVDGSAYAFTAPSGTGKSTHARLWEECFGERVRYVNGDKPIVRFIDGVPYAFGTPWRGKEGFGENISAPLVGIARITRAESNFAKEMSFDDMSAVLLSQIYVPRDPLAAVRTLALLNRLSGLVRLVELGCNMEADAPIVSARALGVEI